MMEREEALACLQDAFPGAQVDVTLGRERVQFGVEKGNRRWAVFLDGYDEVDAAIAALKTWPGCD